MKQFPCSFKELTKVVLPFFVFFVGGYFFFALFFEIAEIRYALYEIKVSFRGDFERDDFAQEFPQKLREISPDFDTRLDFLWWPGQSKPFYEFVLRFAEPLPTVSQEERILTSLKGYLTNTRWYEISFSRFPPFSSKNIRFLSFLLGLFLALGVSVSLWIGGVACKK
ncbi:hypothetical protein [Thermospira aquatica]|uniref:PF12158 family protein n=1 Tax=Thermospira aquatica TaxID=2828656 RepID=A0AAX3BF13_9SPIR|nr:hypothetical protein [Thermospira aquatica]URA10860.1 hypothetical protein KDW03_03375 [Thermospira aquatica]